MTEQLVLGWAQIEYRCAEIAASVRGTGLGSVYGVPRGGCVPAALIAAHLGLPLVADRSDRTLVVDDLVDSGATLAALRPARHAVLYRKSWSPSPWADGADPVPRGAWVVFPWETTDGQPGTDEVLRLLQTTGLDTSGPELRARAAALTPDVAAYAAGLLAVHPSP